MSGRFRTRRDLESLDRNVDRRSRASRRHARRGARGCGERARDGRDDATRDAGPQGAFDQLAEARAARRHLRKHLGSEHRIGGLEEHTRERGACRPEARRTLEELAARWCGVRVGSVEEREALVLGESGGRRRQRCLQTTALDDAIVGSRRRGRGRGGGRLRRSLRCQRRRRRGDEIVFRQDRRR